MARIAVAPGQIWRDECYYLDTASNACKRKYYIVLAENDGDAVTALFTSKPNGLTESPACSLGPPRAGYFIGNPGGAFGVPTWVEFSSLKILDNSDLAIHIASGRTQLVAQLLPKAEFCGVLRCVMQSEDITNRQRKWVGDALEHLQHDR